MGGTTGEDTCNHAIGVVFGVMGDGAEVSKKMIFASIIWTAFSRVPFRTVRPTFRKG